MRFEFATATRIIFGVGRVREVGAIAQTFGRRALVVTGGRPAFRIRLLLAATLLPLYGIYSGYELCENTPVNPRSSMQTSAPSGASTRVTPPIPTVYDIPPVKHVNVSR